MPLSYIILNVMKLLREHKKNAVLSRNKIESIIDDFFSFYSLTDEVRINYDLDEKIDSFLNEYRKYFYEIDSNIILMRNVSTVVIDDLIELSFCDMDREVGMLLAMYFRSNIDLYSLIGIKIEKELYVTLSDFEYSIELAYVNYAKNKDDKILKQLELDLVKRNFLLNQIRHSLSIEEAEDLYKYGSLLGENNNFDDVFLPIKKSNPDFEDRTHENPFHKALFTCDSICDLAVQRRLFDLTHPCFHEQNSEESFYRKVYDIIDTKAQSDKELIMAKTRLMYVLDYLCVKDNNYDYLVLGRSNKDIKGNNYDFMKNEIYFLIDELFTYCDEEMIYESDTNYFNKIKICFIEAYYELANDERIIPYIVNNQYYHNKKAISTLFDNIVKSKKYKKIKRIKEDK